MKKVLIIGVGSIGHRHLRVFNSTGRVDMAICETNAQLRQEIAERYGIQEAHSTLEEALVTPPDLAVICTPAHLHIPMAIQLATAGVDILIEKPLAISTQQISLLQEIVDQKELICGVAYVMRHHPVMRDILEIIETARFGTPLQYTLTSGQHFPHYRPAYRDIYYTSHATGGGAIQDALTHMMNAAHWLFGPATSLLCDASHLALQDVTVEDTVHALTRHGKLMGSLTLNQFQAPNESTLQINFERCSIRAEFHRNQWRQCDH
ncbi:MAG: Gfo/Idh/MocA family oxidoreductase, partial [Planctomycetota bacterium]|nr:Gfo/Idh/MocA family oxidoreductase [Planctomycetota bacterium]